jgi:hypothetical protein
LQGVSPSRLIEWLQNSWVTITVLLVLGHILQFYLPESYIAQSCCCCLSRRCANFPFISHSASSVYASLWSFLSF